MIPFISAEDLSAYLSTDTQTVTLVPDDLIVLIALDSGSQAVRDEIHRTINLSTETVEMTDGSGTDALVLRNRPIVELTEIAIDGEVMDLTFVSEDKGAGILYFTDGSCWPRGRANITVTYAHGYALSESDLPTDDDIARVPASLRLVALKLAAAVWRSRGPSVSGGNVTEEHIGTYQYRIQVNDATTLAAQYLTDEDRRMIASHRSAVVA